MTDLQKPILKPVKVPWQVTSAVPYLKVVLDETGMIEASFYANVLKVVSNREENSMEVPDLEDEARVVVTFRGAYLLASHTGGDGENSFNYNDFDTTLIKLSVPDSDYVRWGLEFRKQWLTTQFCPDPNMYEVINTRWSPAIGGYEEGYVHYIILGEQIYVDIMARDWSWAFAQ